MKTIIVGMVYKSTLYLDFMMQGLYRHAIDAETDYLIIANDPTETVLEKLKRDHINHIVYRDPKPNDYYLNRVYRAWNFGGLQADGDIVVFINSDMGFTPGWLTALKENLTPSTIPCSRLVESGKLVSGQHAISKDFGRSPKNYRETDFITYANSIKEHSMHDGGLFMPCAFYQKDFVESGGYPEGNIYSGGIGEYRTKFLESGDHYYFYNNPVMSKKRHITVFNSIVYHIQEGEKDE